MAGSWVNVIIFGLVILLTGGGAEYESGLGSSDPLRVSSRDALVSNVFSVPNDDKCSVYNSRFCWKLRDNSRIRRNRNFLKFLIWPRNMFFIFESMSPNC